MNIMLIMIAVMTAVSVGLALAGFVGALRSVELQERTYFDPLPPPMRMLWPLVTIATRWVAPRLSTVRMETTHKKLQGAGLDYTLTSEEFYGLCLVSASIGGTIFLLGALMLSKGGGLLAFIFGLLLGWVYPTIWLNDRRKARVKAVLRDLPVYLDFITMSVEAGLNVTGGIEQSVEKGPPGALAQEFARMLRDLRAGLPRSDALKRMADRISIPQVTNFTSALIQTDKVGANLGETLRAQAHQRREERFLRAEKLALEAPVKMMLPLVMFFFPLIFIFLGYFLYLKMIQEGIL